MKKLPENNPFYRPPENPNYLKRRIKHDYNRPARYMITLSKADDTPPLSIIKGFKKNDCKDGGKEYNGVVVELSSTGELIETVIPEWLHKYPQIRMYEHVVMPDHVHMCIYVMDYLKTGLSRAIANLMGMVSRKRYDSQREDEKNGAIRSFFSKGFNDKIAYTDEQWDRQRWYVIDNPRRYLIKRMNPDLFYATWIIKLGGMEFEAKGNILLLKNPDLQTVRFSRRFTETQFSGYVMRWKECIETGGVLISPFIHPKEREVRDYALSKGGSVIRICENGFSGRFSPQGSEFKYMETSRLLLIAFCGYNSQKEKISYSKAQEMNALAERIARYDWSQCEATFRRK